MERPLSLSPSPSAPVTTVARATDTDVATTSSASSQAVTKTVTETVTKTVTTTVTETVIKTAPQIGGTQASSNLPAPARDTSSPPAAGLLLATIRGSNAAAKALLALVNPSGHDLGNHQGLRQPVAVGDQFEYRILLLPKSSQVQWILGVGPEALGDTSGGVDFRLRPMLKGPFWDSYVDAISPQHIRITLNCQSGAIILQAISHKPTLIMRGNDGDTVDATLLSSDPAPSMSSDDLLATSTTSSSSSSASWMPVAYKTRFRIGPFDFTLQLPRLGRKSRIALRDASKALAVRRGYYPAHRLGRWSVLENMCQNGEYQLRLNPSPPTTCYNVFGVHYKTGKPAMIVNLHYDKSTYRSVHQTISNLRRVGGEAETGVLGLRDIWCQHENGMQQHRVPGDCCDNIYYSTPLPEYDFTQVTWSRVDTIARIAYFHQTLVGLAKIHAEGMIHGTIRPHALVLVPSEEPSPTLEEYNVPTIQRRLRAAITDIESATEGPTRHDQPTLATQRLFSAPEVRRSTIQNQYTYSADIWSLAVSWLSTFGLLPAPTGAVDRRAYLDLRQTLSERVSSLAADHHIYNEFVSLMKSMILWDPHRRATMAEILRHPVWRPLLVQDEARENEEEEEEEEEPEHEHRRKRVCVRSPMPADTMPAAAAASRWSTTEEDMSAIASGR